MNNIFINKLKQVSATDGKINELTVTLTDC